MLLYYLHTRPFDFHHFYYHAHWRYCNSFYWNQPSHHSLPPLLHFFALQYLSIGHPPCHFHHSRVFLLSISSICVCAIFPSRCANCSTTECFYCPWLYRLLCVTKQWLLLPLLGLLIVAAIPLVINLQLDKCLCYGFLGGSAVMMMSSFSLFVAWSSWRYRHLGRSDKTSLVRITKSVNIEAWLVESIDHV